MSAIGEWMQLVAMLALAVGWWVSIHSARDWEHRARIAERERDAAKAELARALDAATQIGIALAEGGPRHGE